MQRLQADPDGDDYLRVRLRRGKLAEIHERRRS